MSAAPVLTCAVEPEDRDAIRTQCAVYGRTTVDVADVPAAEAEFNGAAPAVVFLSAALAGEDALAVCGRWKGAQPEVPIVFLAPDDEMETKLDAVSAGADQFLVYPVEDEALDFVLRFFFVEKGR